MPWVLAAGMAAAVGKLSVDVEAPDGAALSFAVQGGGGHLAQDAAGRSRQAVECSGYTWIHLPVFKNAVAKLASLAACMARSSRPIR